MNGVKTEESAGNDSVRKSSSKRVAWSAEEVQKLKEGVEMYGVGNWAQIHANMSFSHLRSTVDLKVSTFMHDSQYISTKVLCFYFRIGSLQLNMSMVSLIGFSCRTSGGI